MPLFPRARRRLQASYIPAAVLQREHNEAARRSERAKVQALLDRLPHRVIVVSDLHLGRGRSLVDGRFDRMENFVEDESFARMLDWFGRVDAEEGQLLILAGDVCDFVRHAVVPDAPEDFAFWQKVLARIGVNIEANALRGSISTVETTYGLRSDPVKSVWKLADTARGHGAFFQGLAEWVKRGHSILIVKGNHDLEMHWLTVRDSIRAELAARGVAPTMASDQVVFADEPPDTSGTVADAPRHVLIRFGNVFLEHGHQYEETTRVDGPPCVSDLPSELTYPVGSFINRYLINDLEKLEPNLDNLKPVQDAVLTVIKRHPIRAIEIWAGALRFLGRVLWMRRLVPASLIFGYLLALLVPPATLLAIVAAFVFPPVAEWFKSVLGPVRQLLSVVGVAFPYVIGAIKDLVISRKANLGEKMLERLQADVKEHSSKRVYLVAGHTHDQAVDRLVPAPRVVGFCHGQEVFYLNTGTWVPLWPKDRPDLIGRTLHPVLELTNAGDGEYRHQYWEWDDHHHRPVRQILYRAE